MMTCCLCVNVLLQDLRRRKKLHGASCSSARNVLQKLCPVSFNSVGIWKNKDALMCSMCDNQLKSIDILESKLKNLKEDMGTKISNNLKEEDERSRPESPKEPSAKRVMLEFERKLPTSVLLLKGIIPNPQSHVLVN